MLNRSSLSLAAGFAAYAPAEEVEALIAEIAAIPGAPEAVGHFLADCNDPQAGLERDEVVTALCLAAASVG